MKNKKPVRTFKNEASRFCKKSVYLLSFASSAILLLLSDLYLLFIANFGTTSVFITIYYYFTQLLSVSAFFALVSISIYTYFAGNMPAFAHSLTMNALSSVFVSVLANSLIIWLLAFADQNLDLPFSVSNYSLTELNENGLIYIMSMSFMSVLSLFLVVLVSFLILRTVKRKYVKNYTDLSLDALANSSSPDFPLKTPAAVFAGCFALVSFLFQALDTLTTVTDIGTPEYVNDYIYLMTPYFMLVIYTLAGYFVMQYFINYFAKKTLDLSK